MSRQRLVLQKVNIVNHNARHLTNMNRIPSLYFPLGIKVKAVSEFCLSSYEFLLSNYNPKDTARQQNMTRAFISRDSFLTCSSKRYHQAPTYNKVALLTITPFDILLSKSLIIILNSPTKPPFGFPIIQEIPSPKRGGIVFFFFFFSCLNVRHVLFRKKMVFIWQTSQFLTVKFNQN